MSVTPAATLRGMGPSDLLINIQAVVQGAANVQALAQGLEGLSRAALQFGTSAVRAAGEAEQTAASFEMLLGSTQRADAFLKQLATFAANTPFELKGLQATAQQMLAFGFSTEQVIPLLTAVGDAAGGQTEKIERITRALGQIRAKGKISAEEIGQLAEAGIPAWQMLADKIGVSIPEAMKMAEQGTLTAAQGIPALLQGMTEKYGGMMQRQSQTLLGMWSNFQDNLGQTMVGVGNSIIDAFDLKGVMQQVNEGLGRVREYFQDFDLKAWARENEQAILIVGGALTGVLVGALVSAGASLAALIAPALPVIAAAGAIGAALGLLGVKFEDVRTFALSLVQGFQSLQAQATQEAEGLRSRLAPIMQNVSSAVQDALAVVRDVWQRVALPAWQGIQPTVQRVVQGVLPLLTSFSEFVRGAFHAIRVLIETVLIPAWEAIWPVVQRVLEILGTEVRAGMDMLAAIFSAAGKLLQGDWRGAWETIQTDMQAALSRLVEGLGNAGQRLLEAGATLGRRIRDGILGALGGLAADLIIQVRDAVQGMVAAVPQWIQDRVGLSQGFQNATNAAAALQSGADTGQAAGAARDVLGKMTTDQTFRALLTAIFGQESGGNYASFNTDSGALGKYQVMPQHLLYSDAQYDSRRNTAAWAKANMNNAGAAGQGWDYLALGRDVTPQQFMNSPEIQEAISQSRMLANLQKRLAEAGGDLEKAIKEAAKDWYGRGNAGPGYPTPDEYAESVWKKFTAAAARPTPANTPTVTAAATGGGAPATPAAPGPTSTSFTGFGGNTPAATAADLAKELTAKVAAIQAKLDIKLINRDQAIRDLKVIEDQAIATARKQGKGWEEYAGLAKTARSAIDGIKNSGKGAVDVLQALATQYEYAGEKGLPEYVTGLKAFMAQQDKIIQQAPKGSQAQLDAMAKVNQAQQALEAASESEARRSREVQARMSAINSAARQGRIADAKAELAELERMRDEDLRKAGTNLSKRLSVETSYAQRIYDARKVLLDRERADRDAQIQNAKDIPQRLKDQQLATSAQQYRTDLARLGSQRDAARETAQTAEVEGVRRLRGEYSKLASDIRGKVAAGKFDEDARRAALVSFNALSASARTAGLYENEHAEAARRTTWALLDQGIATSQAIQASSDRIAQIKVQAQAEQDAADDAGTTVTSLTGMLAELIAQDLDPRTTGYVELLDELIRKGGSAGAAAKYVRDNLADLEADLGGNSLEAIAARGRRAIQNAQDQNNAPVSTDPTLADVTARSAASRLIDETFQQPETAAARALAAIRAAATDTFSDIGEQGRKEFWDHFDALVDDPELLTASSDVIQSVVNAMTDDPVWDKLREKLTGVISDRTLNDRLGEVATSLSTADTAYAAGGDPLTYLRDLEGQLPMLERLAQLARGTNLEGVAAEYLSVTRARIQSITDTVVEGSTAIAEVDAQAADAVQRAQAILAGYEQGRTSAEDAAQAALDLVVVLERYAQAAERAGKADVAAGWREFAQQVLSELPSVKGTLDEVGTLAEEKAADTTIQMVKLVQSYQGGTISLREFVAAALEAIPALEALAALAEANGNADLAAHYRGMVSELRSIGGTALKTGEALQKFNTYSQYVTELGGKLAGLAEASGKSDLAANITGAVKAFDLLKGVVADIASGNWAGAAVKVIGSIIDAFTGFARARAEAAKAREDFNKQFSLIDGNALATFGTRSRGWLADVFGGGPEVVRQINEFAANIARTIEQGVKNGFSNGIKGFLNGTGDLLSGIREGVRGAIIDAVTQALIEGAILKGALGTLLTQLTSALAAGQDPSGIIAQIAQALPAVAQTLEQTLTPIKTAIDTAFPGGASGGGSGGSSSPGVNYGPVQAGIPTAVIDILTTARDLLRGANEAPRLMMDAARLQWQAADRFSAAVDRFSGPHASSTLGAR